MKLTGELKKQVEKTTNREEAKETIARAGMLLEDDELESVAGGVFRTVAALPGGEFNLVSPFLDENHDENNKGGK